MSQPAEERDMNEQTARDRLIAACDTDANVHARIVRERLERASRTHLPR